MSREAADIPLRRVSKTAWRWRMARPSRLRELPNRNFSFPYSEKPKPFTPQLKNKMHHPIFALLDDIHGLGTVVLAVIGLVFFIFLVMAIWASRYTKVGPNQVLVVSGHRHRFVAPDGTVQYRGFRIVKGGGTFVLPVLEKVDVLSLELLTIDVQTPEVYTSKGVPVKVDGVAQIKIRGDDVSIATASEQVLSKTIDEIKSVATQTLEGHLRAIIGTMTVEDIYQNRDDRKSVV